MTWLLENWGTLLVLAILALCVFFIVRKVYRDAKCGMGTCGCGCKECAMRGSCHSRARKA